MIRWPGLLTMMLGLAGCGSASGDGVGGVSASEASALNEAAAALDARTGTARSTGDGAINPAAAARAERGRHPPQQPAASPAP